MKSKLHPNLATLQEACRTLGRIFWNFSQAWFTHLEDGISYLPSYIYCRLLIYTHLAHNRYLIISPTSFLHPCVQRQKASLLWKNLKHLLWNYLGGSRLRSPSSNHDKPEFWGPPVSSSAPWNTQALEERKRQLTPARPLVSPTGPDSMAAVSFFAWLCFQGATSCGRNDSFLFFFPKNFLNVLNLDFFFPTQKECM